MTQIISWLLGSMTTKISEIICSILVPNKFGKTLDIRIPCSTTSLHVELESKILCVKQDALYVAEYCGILNVLWIKLDQYKNLRLKNSKVVATLT